MQFQIMILPFTSISLLIFRTKWAYLFNDDPNVAAIVSVVLPVAAISLAFDGINVVAAGVLRARGMQVTGMLLNLR